MKISYAPENTIAVLLDKNTGKADPVLLLDEDEHEDVYTCWKKGVKP